MAVIVTLTFSNEAAASIVQVVTKQLQLEAPATMAECKQWLIGLLRAEEKDYRRWLAQEAISATALDVT